MLAVAHDAVLRVHVVGEQRVLGAAVADGAFQHLVAGLGENRLGTGHVGKGKV